MKCKLWGPAMMERAPRGRAARRSLRRNEPRGPLMRRGGWRRRGDARTWSARGDILPPAGRARRRVSCPSPAPLPLFPEAVNPLWQTAPRVTHEFRGTNLLGVGCLVLEKPAPLREKYSSCLRQAGAGLLAVLSALIPAPAPGRGRSFYPHLTREQSEAQRC